MKTSYDQIKTDAAAGCIGCVVLTVLAIFTCVVTLVFLASGGVQ